MNKYNKFSERFWFFMAALATIGSIIIAFLDGLQVSLVYFLISGIAWGMYLVKAGIRKRMEVLEQSSKGKKASK